MPCRCRLPRLQAGAPPEVVNIAYPYERATPGVVSKRRRDSWTKPIEIGTDQLVIAEDPDTRTAWAPLTARVHTVPGPMPWIPVVSGMFDPA